MKIDIVPIKENYRGIGRSLLATDLLTKKSKKDFAKLLEMYDAYLMLLEQPESQNDCCESLLENMSDRRVQQTLNKNGLCRNAADISKLLPLLDAGDVMWRPCYVYRVLEK